MGINLNVNSVESIQQRTNEGIPGWKFLLFVVFARPLLLFIAHLVFAAVFAVLGDKTPFKTAGPYWSVYGTIADIGCLLLLHVGMQKEGIRIVNLISFDKKKLPKDILWGLGIWFAGGLIVILGSKLAGIISYGSLTPIFPEGAYIRSCHYGLFYIAE